MDRQTRPNELDTAPREPVTRSSLASDLRALGLVEGATVIVHTSMARLGPVIGGAQAVIVALLDTLGERGTLVMPAHSGQLSDPAHWRAPPAPEAWWDTIRQEMPAYDPALTPTRNMGAVAESFRTYPGVRRSAHPQVVCCPWTACGTNRRRTLPAIEIWRGFSPGEALRTGRAGAAGGS